MLESTTTITTIDKIKSDIEKRMKGAITIIIFGASGDLAKKKTYPALYSLFKNNLLPNKVQIVGYARTKMDRTEFHKRVILSHITIKDDNQTLDGFLKICHYVQGQYDQDEYWKKLNNFINNLEEEQDLTKEQKNRLFYMALPPNVYIAAATGIKKFVYGKTGSHNSVVIEKPFGKDLISCQDLLQEIKALFKEEEVYRIDHYLGKELIKNIMVIRFSNMIFHTFWTGTYIDSVQITLKESFGVEGRGGYFDEYGIIRDVMQNHLLQLVSLVAMERPISRESEAIRDEKVKVLKCVQPINLEDTLLGQYIQHDDKPGYLDEETVPHHNQKSICPTFAAMVLWINNERWSNVPFILKAGKGLDTSKVEIRIQFKKLPCSGLFDEVARNEFVFRIQPDEAMYMKFNSKYPGFSDGTLVTELNLTYKKRFENLNVPDAYETLLVDLMKGDQKNFVRDDELQEAWRIFTPLLHQIEKYQVKPNTYPFGSRGPQNLDDFVRKYGVELIHGGNYQWPLQYLGE